MVSPNNSCFSYLVILLLTASIGIVSSNIYRAKDKPRFKPGHAVVLAYEALFLLGGSVVQHVLLRRENAKRRNGERNHWVEGKTEEEIDKLGDKRPDFLYTL